METWQPKDISPINRKAARQANTLGATVVRSCSGGLMRWSDRGPSTEVLLSAMARALRSHKQELEELNVLLAIELHFEFTTFELLRLFEMCGAQPGGYLGICLDTMNLLTMLEDPLAGTERILPWVVAVHAKDGGLLLDDQGLCSFTAAAGTGQVDFPQILARLATLDRRVNLSVEDHGGSFRIPIFEPEFLTRFPDLTAPELTRLVQLAVDGGKRVAAGSLAPLDRSAWPQECERRVQLGIRNIKRIAERIPPACGATAAPPADE
jgi:sugar phosphate isomerase/epimerase